MKRLFLLGLVMLGLIGILLAAPTATVPKPNGFVYQTYIWEEPEYKRWVVQINVKPGWGDYSTQEEALAAGVEAIFIYPQHRSTAWSPYTTQSTSIIG